MKKPCNYPGCPTLIEKGRYCLTHASSANNSKRDYEAKRKACPVLSANKAFRSSSAWTKVQRLKRTITPLCEDPFSDHARTSTTASAMQAHHIKPLTTHPELALSLENLMSVCTRCHAKLEAKVRQES